MKKRLLCIVLSALCVIGTFVSCADKKDEKSYSYNIDDTKFNVIEADGTSKFVIVRRENAQENVLSACMNLKNSILDMTGVDIEVKSDFEKAGHPEFQRQDYEILVGKTNREESDIAAKDLVRAKDFSILQSGTRIAISARDDSYIAPAVEYFIENYIDAENCSVALDYGKSETVLYDYDIDSFTINGVDASEYSVYYRDDDYKAFADTINTFILDNYGYRITVGKTAVSGEHVIMLQPSDETEANNVAPLESVVSVEDGNIKMLSGILADHHKTVSDFVNDYFGEDCVSSDIEYIIESSVHIDDRGFIRVDDTELLNEIDRKAIERREYITNTPNEYTELSADSKSRIFYVSNDGSDSNNGLSENEPIQSIEKVNTLGLIPGDRVLFRRGDEFRGKIKCSNGAIYSSYGTGAKPIINGSKRNFADSALWQETDIENVYKCAYTLDNVGNIIFDYSGIIGNYDETIGTLKVVGADGFESYKDLANDLEFASNLSSGELYLYSSEGNPGERFNSIEIAEAGNIFQGSNEDVIVDNLTMIFGGSHGVGSGTVENRTVKNCIFAWIGGSVLKGFNGGNVTRYGNAVEVYGGCDGYYVYDNWIYQIYDTGITHQYSNNDRIIKMQNIEYRGNLVELCHWSIEYYNRGAMPGSLLKDVHVHDNMTLYGCYGWGSVGREGGGALHNSFQIVDDVTNYVVEDNIFAYSKGNIVRYNEGGDRKIKFRNNTYVQYYNRALGYMFGKTEKYDGHAVSLLTDTMNEESPIIVFIMNDEEKAAEEAARIAAEEAEREADESQQEEAA